MTYQLVKHSDHAKFVADCDDALDSGYRPIGGVQMAAIKYDDGDVEIFFAQAFVADDEGDQPTDS